MSSFASMLGPELVDNTGKVYKTAEKLEKSYVAIYCSAIWCAPCRKFTPILTALYNRLRSLGKNFEIVFSSWDSDSEGFNDYFSKMPWLAIPFASNELRENIKTKYTVNGIPTLIILGPNGELLNPNAREAISQDVDGENYPWSTQHIYDLLNTDLYKDVSGTIVPGSSLKGHIFGLYFSASWCPSCKIFTPKLRTVYNKLKAANKDFEVVYIPRDRDEEGYKDYYGKMPWLSLPYGQDSTRDLLLASQGVRFIPCFVLFNEKGEKIRFDGRDAVDSNPEGYPWIPPTLLYMNKSPDAINETQCIILFSSDSGHRAIFERLSLEKKKDDFSYILCNIEDGVSAQIRELTHQTKNPLLMIIDIPQEYALFNISGAYYTHEGELTYEGMSQFVDDYFNGKINRQQMG